MWMVAQCVLSRWDNKNISGWITDYYINISLKQWVDALAHSPKNVFLVMKIWFYLISAEYFCTIFSRLRQPFQIRTHQNHLSDFQQILDKFLLIENAFWLYALYKSCDSQLLTHVLQDLALNWNYTQTNSFVVFIQQKENRSKLV